MSPEMKDLLHDAARTPQQPVDADALHARGRRRTARRTAAAGTALALVATLGAVSLIGDDEPDPMVVAGPEPGTDPDGRPTTDPGGRTSPIDAGVDLMWVVDGNGEERSVVLVRPGDGSPQRVIEIDSPEPTRDVIVADDGGGFFWQRSEDEGPASTILHVDAEGRVTEALPAPSDEEVARTRVRHLLVGGGDGRALVARRTGGLPEDTTEQLIEIRPDGTTRDLAAPMPAWESAWSSASGDEVLLVAESSEGTTSAIVVPPRGEPTVVTSRDFGVDGVIADVAATGERGYALVLPAGDGDATLLAIDLAAGEVADELSIPAELLGAETVRDADLHLEGSALVVNRDTGEGFLPPILLDLDDVEYGWTTLDGPPGRAMLARAHRAATTSDSPCATEDDPLRNAAPSGDGLHLYLACDGEGDPSVVYRTDLARASSDPVADARDVLDDLLGDLPDELRARGYSNLGGAVQVGVRSVVLDGARLTVDFALPDSGMGVFSTSHGSAVWHALLAANLLQLDGVGEVALLADGDCERYSQSFEGDGCVVIGADRAPWNPSAD